jgi:pre-mRNA-splicing factor 38A
VRLTFDPVNVYEVLEPLLDDYRKIRFRRMGVSTSLRSSFPSETRESRC